MSSPGLVIPCAIGTVNKQKKIKERAAMVPATARDDQPTDNMIQYKKCSINVAYRFFYWK